MTERVTIQQAARLLETTEGAIRKRVQRGSLDSERGEDGRVYVRVDAGEARPDERHDAGLTDQDTTLAAKDELVAVLQEQLAAERAAHGETRRILAGLVQRLPEIEAAEHHEPSETRAQSGAEASGEGERRPNDKSNSRGSQEPAEGDSVRSPWWVRLFGRRR